eukprot:Tbor_TRINITY_DN278_c0_g1::TRINITY_DN278_c0_g1_i1::g.12215::m.12215
MYGLPPTPSPSSFHYQNDAQQHTLSSFDPFEDSQNHVLHPHLSCIYDLQTPEAKKCFHELFVDLMFISKEGEKGESKNNDSRGGVGSHDGRISFEALGIAVERSTLFGVGLVPVLRLAKEQAALSMASSSSKETVCHHNLLANSMNTSDNKSASCDNSEITTIVYPKCNIYTRISEVLDDRLGSYYLANDMDDTSMKRKEIPVIPISVASTYVDNLFDMFMKSCDHLQGSKTDSDMRRQSPRHQDSSSLSSLSSVDDRTPIRLSFNMFQSAFEFLVRRAALYINTVHFPSLTSQTHEGDDIQQYLVFYLCSALWNICSRALIKTAKKCRTEEALSGPWWNPLNNEQLTKSDTSTQSKDEDTQKTEDDTSIPSNPISNTITSIQYTPRPLSAVATTLFNYMDRLNQANINKSHHYLKDLCKLVNIPYTDALLNELSTWYCESTPLMREHILKEEMGSASIDVKPNRCHIALWGALLRIGPIVFPYSDPRVGQELVFEMLLGSKEILEKSYPSIG